MSTVTGQPYAYSDRALQGWARRVRRWARDERDAYVYFDNNVKVGAPFDALSLMRKLRLHWHLRATNGASFARHSSGALMLGVS